MRKLKEKKEETKVEENKVGTSFKIKITNIRKTAYPNELKKTDYYGYGVGTILKKGSGLYQVTDIRRVPVHPSMLNTWKVKNDNNPYRKDKKLKDLLDEYEKNGNFGACYIHAKLVLTGNKEPVRQRTLGIYEIANALTSAKSVYEPVNLDSVINAEDYLIHRDDYRMQRMQDKKKKHIERHHALTVLKQKLENQNIIAKALAEATIEVQNPS